ncbi:hypothetical protein SCUCBS95973_002357 [Sporothrix curviconia]|uniref:Zn(2)-C6 fungal-type domain-containing protein n=1 Tax=Sporothrix curviconia TaxID=1260050 RepID=A0ABP0B687_9PEZI
MQPRISQRQSLACRECTRSKRKCSKDIPCTRCRRLGLDCSREVVRLRRVISQNGREIAFLDSLRAELEGTTGAGGTGADGSYGAGASPARIARALQRLTHRVQFLQSGQPASGGADIGPGSDGGGGLASLATVAESYEQQGHRGGNLSSPLDNPGRRDGDAGDNDDNGRRQQHSHQYSKHSGHHGHHRRRSSSPSASSQDMHDSLIVTALEHIAWGRNTGSCYPHRRCACQYNTNGPTHYYSQQILYSPVAARVVQENLPGRARAEAMVRFHLEHVAWHHSCLHAPTFTAQCTRFWATGQTEHAQWLALYLAVISTTHFCLLHSPKYGQAPAFGATAGAPPLAVDPSDPQSAQSLFQAMLDVLHECQFLQNVSLFAVQAIVISTEVAHNLGLSQLNATLLAAAVRIAECLGVHKIEDDPVRRGMPEQARSPVEQQEMDAQEAVERREREIGRRVWLQMVVQDHFAMPFTDGYVIHPRQYATGLPRNCDDADPSEGGDGLVEKPDSLPTISSYNRVLSTLARLVPELADGLGPLRARKPLHEQYEHILAMDQKMRQVVRAIPPFFLRQDPVLEAQVPWLAIARQSMAITAAEKIIMVHRPFLFRSFQQPPTGASGILPPTSTPVPSYIHTRRTCVSAAMTILREHRNITEAGDMSLWTHTAFCITAALLLSFEVLCSAGATTDDAAAPALLEQHATYRSAIQYARTYLSSRMHDVLAQRGVLLIDSLFPGGPNNDAMTPSTTTATGSGTGGSSSIKFDEVVSAFTAGWAMFGLSSELMHQQQQQQQQQRGVPVGIPSPQRLVTRYASGTPILPPLSALPAQPYAGMGGVGMPGINLPTVHSPGDYGQPHHPHTHHAPHQPQQPPPPPFPETMSPNLEDFDAWFQHIFATGHGTTFE